jgi:hypothetical protein
LKTTHTHRVTTHTTLSKSKWQKCSVKYFIKFPSSIYHAAFCACESRVDTHNNSPSLMPPTVFFHPLADNKLQNFAVQHILSPRATTFWQAATSGPGALFHYTAYYPDTLIHKGLLPFGEFHRYISAPRTADTIESTFL